MDRPLGVILAGGASSRMGTDKALLELAGVPMIAWVVTALETISSGIVIAGRQGRMVGYECIPDAYPDFSGPLSGLATVMERAEPAQPLVVVAVDHAFVRGATLQSLVARFDGSRVVVPVADGIRQVTVAVYAPSILKEARRAMERGGSLQSLLEEVPIDEVTPEEWRQWGEDGRSWFSIDTPDDVTEGLASYDLPFK